MRAGILGISSNEPTKVLADPLTKLDDAPAGDPIETETVEQFMSRFYVAKAEVDAQKAEQKAKGSGYVGDEIFLETNPTVFNYLTRHKKTDYLWFQDVKVYVRGTKDKIDDKEDVTIERKLFPNGG